MLAKSALLLSCLAALLAVPSGVLLTTAQARADGACTTWSTYEEQDAEAANLTAVACSSGTDDSSVLGLQCKAKKPELRYYPGDFAQATIRNNTWLAVTLAVGDDGVAKTMRYNGLDGVFSVTISKTDPVLGLLQSGGPLVLTSTTLGAHSFRLIGSNAAVAKVMQGCGIKGYLAPPPPLPDPDPRQDD